MFLILCNYATADEALEGFIANTTEEFNARLDELGKGIDSVLEEKVVNAEKEKKVITVRQDGSGEFKTITDAVKSVPDGNTKRTMIDIGPGVYKEKVLVEKSKSFITFYGSPTAAPTISFDGTAAKFGTWNSATVAVESTHFMAVNIIFENSAPMPAPGVEGGQAVALRISADKAAFYSCKFYGFQDTLLDDVGKHYYKDCLIQGSVDFIFGNARSLYVGCELRSVATAAGVTTLTAQGRSTLADKSGFSFVHCVVNGTGSAFLSRAWRESSRVVFAYTYMGALVNPQGWHNHGHSDREKSVFYGEFQCTGPGAKNPDRASFGREMTEIQAKPFLSETFIRGGTWLLPRPKL